MLSVHLSRGGKRMICAYVTVVPLKDSRWYGPSPEPVQANTAASLTAAKMLALQGTGDQEKIMMMETREEKQAWKRETGLRGNYSPSQEIFRQRFRQLCYQEAPGPREALRRLRALCCEWLRPERHTKEQILEFLVLEQFLTILPEELQSRVRGHHPQSAEEAVTVLEDLEKGHDEPGPQVGRGTQSVVGASSMTCRLDRGAAGGGLAKFKPLAGQVEQLMCVSVCLFYPQALKETLAPLPSPVLTLRRLPEVSLEALVPQKPSGA